MRTEVRFPLRPLCGLLFLALLPAAGEAIYFRERLSWSHRAASDEVDPATATGWGAQALWLDARPQEQFAREHIPGALPLNAEGWDELLPNVLQSWTPGRKIIVYCSEQSCGASREVARRLRDEAGLKEVYVLTGGWEGWQKAR